jgi:hypothetical protein
VDDSQETNMAYALCQDITDIRQLQKGLAERKTHGICPECRGKFDREAGMGTVPK